MPSPNLIQTKTQSKTKTRLAWAVTMAAAAAFSGYILSQKADTICESYPNFCERFTSWTSGPGETGVGTVKTDTSGINQRNEGTRTFEANQESNTYYNEIIPNNEIEDSLVPNDEVIDSLVPNDEEVDILVPNQDPAPIPNENAPDPVVSGGSGSDPNEEFPSGGEGIDAPLPPRVESDEVRGPL